MQPQPMPAVTRYLRSLEPIESDQPFTDSQLLERFAALGKQADFATLLQRHGSMVLGVCRQVLGHQQDAEDAFQVTFLVLARQAASVQKRQALAGWWRRISYSDAEAKRAAARRRKHETRVKAMPTKSPSPDVAWQEIQAALQEEIERLRRRFGLRSFSVASRTRAWLKLRKSCMQNPGPSPAGRPARGSACATDFRAAAWG